MTRAEQQQADIEAVLGSKYHVLCRVGGGGMAQVLLARHRLHGGLFAIKILSDHLAQDPTIVARFKQEATTAASLSGHPNIVPIFDIGEGNGLHYLVMQFVCGEDLSSYLRRNGKLSVAEAASVIAQAAEALSWAESKRVVHRDLKPANMHLDTTGRVKLLDFGISKITDIADGLTRPGEALGTPFYMSPEQIRGEGCDIRSDLYSLGVVFFELLTGRRPFENESATAIQMAHLSTPPPSVLVYDPSIPPMCDAIIQRLLRKNREERYSSVQELLTELHNHGATSGPSTLRPVVDSALAAKIDEPPTPGGCVSETRVEISPPAPTPPPAAIPMPAASGVAARAPAQAVAEPVPPPPPATTQSSPALRIGIISAAVLLVLIAALLFALHSRSKPDVAPGPAATSATGAAVLPSTVQDGYGTMLLVGAGPFQFGSDAADSQQRAQTITLPAFYVDATEVSVKEYKSFLQATGRSLPSAPTGRPDDPIGGVSLQEAEAYAAWAGKRLPTEQEWEKAARGTDGRPYPWGSQPWTNGVPQQLQAVDSNPDRRSPVGAYNMAGNVWEWTSSRYTPSSEEAADMAKNMHGTPFSPNWGALKGGSFSPGGSRGFTAYARRGFPVDQRSPLVGFRCVKDASQ